MSGPGFYDRAGQPISFEAWRDSHLPGKFRTTRCVARNLTTHGHLVSTVWLGLDHSWGEGPPLIFETMVQTAIGEWAEQWRYHTEEQAVAGHVRMLERWLDRPADWKEAP